MITKEDFEKFFAKVEAEADEIEDAAEAEVKKGIAIAGQFLRSTAAALAHDPALTAAIQAGIGGFIKTVEGAVLSGGTSLLPGLAAGAAVDLIRSVGHTAEHQLVPIVQGEIHAAVADLTVAVPYVVNK